jgi:5-carboxymethyl-2-hydroxymuconate isomerase
MKLASWTHDGREAWGAVVGADDALVDLGARMPGVGSLDALLADGALDAARGLAARTPPDLALADVRLRKPLARPGKVVCVGVNYAERNEEYRDGSERPKWPSLFMRTPGSLVAHGEPILRPPESVQLDYEGEIAIVIGRAGRRIPRAQAAAHVAGLTCVNEGTLRDWLRHGKFNVTQGKNFEATGAIGPWIATPDTFDGFGHLRVITRVNGEVRQDDTTERLMFPFEYLVEYVSTFMRLEPGDVISTGTPTGAGARFDPPKWLVPGDIVEVEVPGVGTLRNVVEDERT